MEDSRLLDTSIYLKIVVVILLFVVGGVVLFQFLPGQIFRGHDILDHMIYFRGFHQAVLEGQFPVRFIDNAYPGFNFPVFNYYPTMFYYMTLIPSGLGLMNTDSFNFTLLALWISSGLFMYLFSKRYLGKLGGVVAACFYVLAPYHLVLLFVRMAVSEFTALAFFPALLWAVQSFWEGGGGKKFFLSGVFFAGFLLSHNVTVLIFAPFILAYVIYLYRQTPSRRRLVELSIVLALGLGIAAFFLIPAYGEINYSRLANIAKGESDFHNHFVCFEQLWQPSWGFDGSIPGCNDKMSFQVGIAHWLAVIIFTITLIWQYLIKKLSLKKHPLSLLFLAFFVFGTYMTLPVSSFSWERIPVIQYLQFPWRFLTLVIFASSFLAGSVVMLLGRKNRYLVAVILIGLSIYLYGGYVRPLVFLPEEQIHFNDQLFLQGREDELKGVFGKSLDLDPYWTKQMPEIKKVPSIEAEIIFGEIEITQEIYKAAYKSYQLKAKKESLVRFYTHYFPDWQVKIDGKPASFSIEDELGYINLKIPPGEYRVELIFQDTSLRTMANRISVASALTLLIISIAIGTTGKFFGRS